MSDTTEIHVWREGDAILIGRVEILDGFEDDQWDEALVWAKWMAEKDSLPVREFPEPQGVKA